MLTFCHTLRAAGHPLHWVNTLITEVNGWKFFFANPNDWSE
jgi:hypothetical protein